MDNRQEELESRLDHTINQFKEMLSELEKITDVYEIETYDRITVATTIYLSYECEFLLEELRKANEASESTSHTFASLQELLDHLLDQKSYREQAIKELKTRVDNYPRNICHFLELDPISIELENTLSGRDVIQVLLLELEEDELDNEREKVNALDEVLRCRYEVQIETILDEYSDIEKSYYPGSFWWRHPSDVAAELD